MTNFVVAAYPEEVLSGDIFGTIYDTQEEAENFIIENTETIPGFPKVFKVTVEEI